MTSRQQLKTQRADKVKVRMTLVLLVTVLTYVSLHLSTLNDRFGKLTFLIVVIDISDSELYNGYLFCQVVCRNKLQNFCKQGDEVKKGDRARPCVGMRERPANKDN